ncbi:MAG TPA: EamA family transporter RarD [Thermomicrobiales bacterium]|nr:EamA family transporter RarD [Thermomicrobiales bacterium]
MGSVPVSPPHAGVVQRDAAAREVRLGTTYGFLAYASWGVLPLYFHALAPAQAFEILAHRIVWCLIFCLVLVTLNRDTSWVPIILRHPQRLLLLTLAAFLLAINWGVYIYAVTSGNVVESSLGYFINPLILVLMGVFILHERLRRLQWWAVGLGTIAVLVISFNYGRLPWIALTLACSFATYGFIKNRVGANIGALPSMTVETVVLVPFALAGIIWIERSGNGTFTSEGFGHTLMLLSTGIVTAVPLILFAAAARRVALATMGLLQFFAPVLQFICGVSLLGEVVPLSRWIGFGLVWLALVVLTADTVRTSRSRRRVSIQTAGNTA